MKHSHTNFVNTNTVKRMCQELCAFGNTLCVTLLQSRLTVYEIKWKKASSPSSCWLCSFSLIKKIIV